MSDSQTAYDAKAVLGEHVDRYVASGHRIESRTDHVVTLVAGRPVNHLLHAILSIFTAGLWITGWVIVTLTGGERTVTLSINPDGSIHAVSKRHLGTGARIALSILLALDILAVLLVALFIALFILFAVSTVAGAVDTTPSAPSISAPAASRAVTPAPTSTPVPLGVVNATDGLNMRTEPATRSQILRILPYQTEVRVTGHERQSEGLTWVELEGGGWVQARYLDR